MVNRSLKKLDNIAKKGDTYPIETKHTNGIKIMNKATVTKVFNKSVNYTKTESWSLGFCRMTALPMRTIKAWDLACLLDGMDIPDISKSLKEALNSMTEQEFKDWLAAN